MKTYERFATVLLQLLGQNTAVIITCPGYMPLSVEAIGQTHDGHSLIAISHTAEQNGDLMLDPEMVFELSIPQCTVRFAEPLSFRNDFMGIQQEVYRYDDNGKKTHVNPKLKADLKAFAKTWFANIREQGFLSEKANRRSLT